MTFILFAYDTHDPGGGMADAEYVGTSLSEAINAARGISFDRSEIYRITDGNALLVWDSDRGAVDPGEKWSRFLL